EQPARFTQLTDEAVTPAEWSTGSKEFSASIGVGARAGRRTGRSVSVGIRSLSPQSRDSTTSSDRSASFSDVGRKGNWRDDIEWREPPSRERPSNSGLWIRAYKKRATLRKRAFNPTCNQQREG